MKGKTGCYRGGGIARKGVGAALKGGGMARKGVGVALKHGGKAKKMAVGGGVMEKMPGVTFDRPGGDLTIAKRLRPGEQGRGGGFNQIPDRFTTMPVDPSITQRQILGGGPARRPGGPSAANGTIGSSVGIPEMGGSTPRLAPMPTNMKKGGKVKKMADGGTPTTDKGKTPLNDYRQRTESAFSPRSEASVYDRMSSRIAQRRNEPSSYVHPDKRPATSTTPPATMKKGGKVAKYASGGAVKMTAGAGSGSGRLEKVDAHKASPRVKAVGLKKGGKVKFGAEELREFKGGKYMGGPKEEAAEKRKGKK